MPRHAKIIHLKKMPNGGSDKTLKKDVTPIQGLATVLALRPVSWHWKNKADGAEKQYGFIAQEVETVLPELVSEGTWTDNTQRKFLNTGDMIPYLVRHYMSSNHR